MTAGTAVMAVETAGATPGVTGRRCRRRRRFRFRHARPHQCRHAWRRLRRRLWQWPELWLRLPGLPAVPVSALRHDAASPARRAGTTRWTTGCDADNDGVSDAGDLCPDSAEGVTVDALGCDDAAHRAAGVNFETDSAKLTDESLAILDGVSATLSANPQIRVMVAGHTGSDGDDAYNKDLSQRRCAGVVDYLASRGVDRNNMIAKGFGEEQPIAGNDDAGARHKTAGSS